MGGRECQLKKVSCCSSTRGEAVRRVELAMAAVLSDEERWDRKDGRKEGGGRLSGTFWRLGIVGLARPGQVVGNGSRPQRSTRYRSKRGRGS